MNHDELIYWALREITREGTSSHTNPWPTIASTVEKTRASTNTTSLKIKRIYVIILSVLLTGTAVAYAFYRSMVDPGLQAVEDAGLVTHRNQMAKPTIFNTVSATFAATTTTSQTENGVTVKLDWAYADEIRLAMQLTVTGLSIPSGSPVSDFICTPRLINREGAHINNPGMYVNLSSDQPGNPIELTYISYQNLDADEYHELNFEMDIVVGPCSPAWDFQETNVTPRPVPLIGSYHLSFLVPVYKGIVITPNQTKSANGLWMRLNRIILAPSFIDINVCYQLPEVSFVKDKDSWRITDATINVDGAGPIRSIANSLPQTDAVNVSEHCEDLGFAVSAAQQPKTMVVTIPKIIAFDSESRFLSSDFQMMVKKEMASQGIEVDFNDTGNEFFRIIDKPSGMTEAQARQMVEELLIHEIEGPWIFLAQR